METFSQYFYYFLVLKLLLLINNLNIEKNVISESSQSQDICVKPFSPFLTLPDIIHLAELK